MIGAENQVFENRGVVLAGFRDLAPIDKNVKNEECSQWLVENKGAKKVLPMVG